MEVKKVQKATETKSKKPLLQIKELPKNFNNERQMRRQSCIS
ncbi:hypothetical protein [Bacillus gobiensis]